MNIKKLYFVTENEKKFHIAKHSLLPFNIEVEQLNISTPEIQSNSVEDVACYSAKYAAEETNKPIIKSDFGMVIESLRGFPGPYIKYINSWLNARQFARLYENTLNPHAYFIDALGFCIPGKDPVCFSAKTHGTLLSTPCGNDGDMVDSLFLPDGYTKTIAELSEMETIQLWSNNRFKALAEYIRNKVEK